MTKEQAEQYAADLFEVWKDINKERLNTLELLQGHEEDDPETEIGSLPGSPPPPPPPRPGV